ncbi:MAG: ATP-binding protein [Nitrospira sp.]|nr:ATP-binding protein [Nitrospira sp.]
MTVSKASSWQQQNDEYLRKALAWLRFRLAWFIDQSASSTSSASSEPRSAQQQGARRSSGRDGTQAQPAAGSTSVSEKQLAKAVEELATFDTAKQPPALVTLRRNLGLSQFEREVLLLCAAMEFDTRMASLCAQAQDDVTRRYPTFALAMALFAEPAWDVLSPERPLRYWRLLEINQPGAQPLTTSALRADERIVNYIKGLNYLDDRLVPLLLPVRYDDRSVELPPSQRSTVDAMVRQVGEAGSLHAVPVMQLLGADSPSKQLVASHAAAALRLPLYRLPVELLPSPPAELEQLTRLLMREAVLWPFALYLDAHEMEKATANETHASALHRFLSRSSGIFFLDTQDRRMEAGRASVSFDIGKPTKIEQHVAWDTLLGAQMNGAAARLAGQFNLNLSTIHQIARTTLSSPAAGQQAIPQQLWEACVVDTRPHLEMLAQRIQPKASWEDIVLPEPELNLLHQIAAQVANRTRVYGDWGFAARRARGLSINALFAGESGTGKTMAAEVLANDLRLSLFRIDLSAVVSKYIGETEKNLRRLFDAAEDGGAILFFDEADALFGKRSEVKDSHDRYANIEINYLLQRIEAYRGLAILATNRKSALDSAFMRRIRFVVEFRAHGIPERKAIWERVFPRETETAELDFDRLAQLNLNGGNINNVAMNAAFLAAQAGSLVTMPLIFDAARAEFRKLERPIYEADFQWDDETEVVA